MRRLERVKRKHLLVVALVVAVVAGGGIAAMAGIGGAAAPKTALTRATSLDDVVAQVQHAFGDREIVSASVEGSVLSIKLDSSGVRGTFEAQVLGSAVADWMRSQGQEPVKTIRFPGSEGGAGSAVESDPNVPQLATDACQTAAQDARTGSLILVSAKTLPYLDGTCVFTFTATALTAGSQAAMGALGRLISAIGGPPNERPWLFELDDQNGVPKTGASWMLNTGTTWATPGLAYPLSHG
jgi:hypothetical protein